MLVLYQHWKIILVSKIFWTAVTSYKHFSPSSNPRFTKSIVDDASVALSEHLNALWLLMSW